MCFSARSAEEKKERVYENNRKLGLVLQWVSIGTSLVKLAHALISLWNMVGNYNSPKMPGKWQSKFELKPGRWVFVPTQETGNRVERLSNLSKINGALRTIIITYTQAAMSQH